MGIRPKNEGGESMEAKAVARYVRIAPRKVRQVWMK